MPKCMSGGKLQQRWKGNAYEKPEQTAEEAGDRVMESELKPPSHQQQRQEKSGRRIVELSVLGEQLWCVSCKEALSLANIETEHRRGLGSILLVRCHKCSVVNTCCTDKRHESAADERNIRFDINFKAAMGTLTTGIGWTHFNKLLACMNIPTIDFKTYKRYKEQVENSQSKKESTNAGTANANSCKQSTNLQQVS